MSETRSVETQTNATSSEEIYCNPSLSMILENQKQLYDLHTHLLGMGNAGFWIDSILNDTMIMPTNATFRKEPDVRRDLCPLIWDQIDNIGFVNGNEAARFIDFLITSDLLPAKDLDHTCNQIRERFPYLSLIFCNLIRKKGLNEELEHRGLSFSKDFSYDVVLKISDLAKGLGVQPTDPDDLVQMRVAEKLGMHLSEERVSFRYWIVFNAREQKFEIVHGILVGELRQLIAVHPNAPNEAKRLARAHIINAFSMCDAQGTPARNIDFHNFRGTFTPEFYPRRFALKDSIYSQRLDILAALLNHVLKRYQVCLPPVKYCEFSVGVGDLSRAWVFDVLRSFVIHPPQTSHETTQSSPSDRHSATYYISSFAHCVHDGHFPYLEVACRACRASSVSNPVLPSTPNVTYKFLAGFDRRKVTSPLPKNVNEALSLLNDSPQRAIQLMLREIEASEKSDKERPAFSTFQEELKTLEQNGETINSFYHSVVGIDLFGDELGYPYCPFVARSFLKYVLRCRKKNPSFGVRIHCGENVPFADIDTSAYRLFIAHMYIVFRCLLFLQQELKHSIRIGHGIAFERILGNSMSKLHHRKSSVLLAEMRHYAKRLFQIIAFEVNITSNEYLLGDTLRQGDFSQALRLDALFALNAPVILATDDDGIWPIDRCSFVHPGHHSLAAEYCRAISSSLITTPHQLNSILKATKNFCFFGGTDSTCTSDFVLPADYNRVSTLIIHPDIIKDILHRCNEKERKSDPFYRHYFEAYSKPSAQLDKPVAWGNKWESMLQVAYICFRTKDDLKPEEPIIPTEYYDLFTNDTDGSKFRYVYSSWRRVYSSFIDQDAKENNLKESYVPVDKYVSPEVDNDHRIGRQNSFYSKPHNSNQSPSPSEPLIEYLKTHRYNHVTIHAYAGNIDAAKTTENLNTELQDKVGFENISLILYTNNDKNKFTYHKSGNRLRLQVNPESTRRDENEDKFLYALCFHAGAATAALHFIVDQISSTAPVSERTTVASTESESSPPPDISLGMTNTDANHSLSTDDTK